MELLDIQFDFPIGIQREPLRKSLSLYQLTWGYPNATKFIIWKYCVIAVK
jgi:hypothetical protein